MTRRGKLSTVALAASLCAAPAVAQNQQGTQQIQNQQGQQQTQGQQTQQQDGALGQQQLSEEGRACVERLQQANAELGNLGYGRVGPGGYGVYGTGYGRAPGAVAGTGTAAAPGTGGEMTRPLAATPRSDMAALMRAGYVMARTGYDQGCEQIAEAVEDIGQRYQQAVESGEIDANEMAQWRQTYLADAVRVSEAQQPLHADQIIGSDLRNLRDEDLGDIEDVVIGPDGEIRYVVVSTGGFLGIGQDEVPVPWDQLRVTTAPYSDTFVLDVSEQAFERAPTLNNGERRQLAEGESGQYIENFWQEQLNQNQQNPQTQQNQQQNQQQSQ